MSVELPRRFTQSWIERTLPSLSAADTDLVLAAMRAKGWSEQELRERVYPHVRKRGRPLSNESSHPIGSSTSNEPRRRRRRLPFRKLTLTELGAIAGIIGALAAVIALFGPFGSADKPKTPKGPSGSATAPADSSRAQAKLLQHVPPIVRRTCESDEDLRKKFRATAQFSCKLDGADQVAYYTFATSRALDAAYRPQPKPTPYGQCGKKWNVESGYHTQNSEGAGLLKCYTYKGTAWIVWTHDDLLLFAYASRSDGNQARLFKAWNEAGPIPNTATH